MTKECPFCKSVLQVGEVTTTKQAEHGLAYLKAKCVNCLTQIESAGIGHQDAEENLNERIEKRIGTNPKMWSINTKRIYRRRG